MRNYCDSNYASFNQNPKPFEGGYIFLFQKYIVENAL